MKVIIPNPLTLLSCSLPETDAEDGVVWQATATYAKDAKARHRHTSYASLDDGNKGNDPEKTWSGTGAKWKKIGATMPWRMLDEYLETQTRGGAGQTLSFCVPFNRADSFALLNLEGYEIRIRIYDDDEDGALVYDSSRSLIADIWHLSLYEYNYLPITNIANLTVTDLPQVFSGRLCIELDPGDATESAAIGHVVAGRSYDLGFTLYGAERGFTDYSRKNTDEFGRTTLVRRSYASRASLPVFVHPDQMDYVIQILENARGIPAIWIGDNEDSGHASLTVYGWMEDFRMVCEGPNENQLSLEIQGLI